MITNPLLINVENFS